MLFNSYIFFFIYMPAFLVLYFLVRGRGGAAAKAGSEWLIVIFSLLFYVPFGWRNLLVLCASLVVNAVLAWAIARGRGASGGSVGEETAPGSEGTPGAGNAAAKAGGRLLLGAAVVLNVACLLAFKFRGTFFPVAISFYTFNQIAYLVELWRGREAAQAQDEGNGAEAARSGGRGEFSLLDYLAYILFFPKLLQGPLMAPADFDRELEKSLAARVDFEVLLRGLYLFSLGLFKKAILADTFGKAVDAGFGSITGLGSLEAVLVAVFYSFQLYFDFSGYCDMAAAICMMMGFELPLNFNSPYKAVNIVDFWKRWHITLTKFFTKYVYIPLGGNRKGAARMYVNLMIVFLVSGLWHGSGWTFIVWGALHGVLYMVTRMLGAPAGRYGVQRDMPVANDAQNKVSGKISESAPLGETLRQKLVHAGKVFLTFAYVTLAWVFFRADTVRDALTLIGRMFVGGGKPIATAISSCFMLDELWYVIKVTPLMKLGFAWDLCLWLFVVVAVAIIFFARNAIERARECTIGVKMTLLTGILLVWSVVSFAGVSTFLYMNF